MQAWRYSTGMNLQIGVKLLIRNSEGKLLFIKRTKLLSGETEPSWDIPGGRIEPEESLHDALVRELSEELGITISGEPHLINAQDIFVEPKNLHVVRLTYVIVANIATEAITLSDEHQELIWQPITDALTENIEPFLRQTLEIIHES